ncbi:MAG TPA: nitroreductase family protein [Candidatus Altiarchaeales archaeon]|nr:nitroreductase family protein [Candidatus Altiarchaeales archaeon]
MQVFEAIKTRRSTRSFKKDDVTPQQLEKILEAGRWAPSGLNNQPWKFKTLSENEKKIVSGFTKYRKILEQAPAAIAVFMDTKLSYNRDKDVLSIGACIQNMLLETHEQGLGGLWMGEILNQKEKVREALHLPETLELMAVIAVGHPSEEKPETVRKNLSELMLY